jgi:hypothetical protein
MTTQIQTATFNPSAKTKFTIGHRKEGKCFFDQYSILIPSKYDSSESHAVIDLRLYGTGNKNFACIWINYNDTNTSGTGSAGGYGYHRPSAAAAEAISNAGITLSKSISGVGDTAIREALKAIAAALGIENGILHHAHQ